MEFTCVSFACTNRGLTDVSILKNYKHIRYVVSLLNYKIVKLCHVQYLQDISGNALEDISSLALLPHLLSIKADHNRLTTAHLPELQYLQIASFAHNRITSTEGVAHPMLASLDLSCKNLYWLVIETMH